MIYPILSLSHPPLLNTVFHRRSRHPIPLVRIRWPKLFKTFLHPSLLLPARCLQFVGNNNYQDNILLRRHGPIHERFYCVRFVFACVKWEERGRESFNELWARNLSRSIANAAKELTPNRRHRHSFYTSIFLPALGRNDRVVKKVIAFVVQRGWWLIYRWMYWDKFCKFLSCSWDEMNTCLLFKVDLSRSKSLELTCKIFSLYFVYGLEPFVIFELKGIRKKENNWLVSREF